MDIETKDLARALRRHHVARLKRSRQHYWGHSGTGTLDPMNARQLGFCVATPHPCSSLCCGNPRKWLHERTVQEERQILQFLDNLKEAVSGQVEVDEA